MKKNITSIMKNSQAIMKITGSDKGVLLLHGFKGSPYEMKYLGEKISAQGYSVSIPRLPGHGTRIQEVTRVTDRDWIVAAREALVELNSHCREVYLVGLSMGGLLSILLASEFPVTKMALLSVPCTLKEKTIYLAPLIGAFKKILWKEDNTKGLASAEARLVHEGYSEGIPTRQSWALFKIIRKGMKALPGVMADVLLIQSKNDRVIPRQSIDYIHERIGSKNKDRFLLEKSDHAITVDLEKDLVVEQVIRFLEKN